MGIGSSGVVNCANTYLGTANYTVADGYVADRTPIVDGNGPAQLNLNFARNEVLDPRITFSRTSNATRVNAQGLIEYAPHNLLTYSENFDNAVWIRNGASTVTTNNGVAPDGTLTADTFTATSNNPTMQQVVGGTVGIAYTTSIWIKRKTGTGQIYLRSVENLNVPITVTNDWQRFSLATVSTTTTIRAGVAIANNGDEIYIWGAQLNVGALQPYYTTSVKNLLGYSQNFENAAWTKSNSTIDATPVMGPLGFLGAEKLVEDTATNTHLIQQTPTYQAGVIYTHSVYAKAGERTVLQLHTTSTSTFSASFDLVNGTYSQLAANTTAVITSVGNGWFRCSITFTAGASAVGATRIGVMLNDTTQSYTGDGTSGIYIFGAQLSDSASLDPYVYNFGAAPTSSAYYGPRFDYDPVTLAPKGLLIEESRTNLLLQSNFAGAVVGTPGTVATSWTLVNSGGAIDSVTIDEIGQNIIGMSATVNRQVFQQTVAFAANTSYYCSSYVVNNSGLAINQLIGVFTIPTGATSSYYLNGVAVVNPNVTIPVAGDRIAVLVVVSTTAGSGSFRIGVGVSGNSTGSHTFKWPQLEAGSFPTSYIPTNSGQVTRTADNASMVGTNFSSWYNQSEGTVTVETDVNYPASATGYPITIGVNFNDSLIVYRQSDAQPVWRINTAGVNYYLGAYGNVWSDNLVKKLALGYQENNTSSAYNGLGSATDTTVTLPVATQLSIGSLFNSSSYINGHIQSFKYFNKRLLNSYLQSLTQ